MYKSPPGPGKLPVPNHSVSGNFLPGLKGGCLVTRGSQDNQS